MVVILFVFVFLFFLFVFFFKQKTAYEILAWLEFRRVLFRSIVDLANSLRSKNNVQNRTSVVYYWGNVPAVDLINLTANEGIDYRNPLDLLLCGVGDPRNVILSIASLPECYMQKVTFVLNDICACALARTVLLIYMLYKGEWKHA